MSDGERAFTAGQAAAANTALRAALGLPPERFPVARFVAMLSDEIEGLRAAGHDDDGIARLVREGTGADLTGADVTAHSVPSDRRRQPG